MNQEKYEEMMNVIGDYVIAELKNDEEKSPALISAISELVGKVSINLPNL